jgi:hypothetical protein
MACPSVQQSGIYPCVVTILTYSELTEYEMGGICSTHELHGTEARFHLTLPAAVS